jgi:hypothetical protein
MPAGEAAELLARRRRLDDRQVPDAIHG